MKKKNILTGIIAAGLIATTTMGLSGCTNKRLINFDTNADYIVVQEGSNYILHEVKSWVQDKNNYNHSIIVTTDCCNNNIWTTHENSVLYKEKPSENAYTAVCEHIHE